MLLCQWAALYFLLAYFCIHQIQVTIHAASAHFQIYVKSRPRPISHLVDVGSGTGKFSLTAKTFVCIMTANLRLYNMHNIRGRSSV